MHGELFIFVHEYGMKGGMRCVYVCMRVNGESKNTILILRIFTSGKNSQRSYVLFCTRWYGVDNRFSRVQEKERARDIELATKSTWG